jgi:hypothetical protein
MLWAEEDDAVQGEVGFLGGGDGGGEVGELGNEALCAGVAELEGELIDGVERVGGRDGAACPEGAEGEYWGLALVLVMDSVAVDMVGITDIDGIGRVERQDVPLLPFPVRLQCFAEFD